MGLGFKGVFGGEGLRLRGFDSDRRLIAQGLVSFWFKGLRKLGRGLVQGSWTMGFGGLGV